jgi:hypothetical protein
MSASPPERNVTLSIVSHRQNVLVNELLGDIKRLCADRVALVLTQNAPDSVPLQVANLPCPVQVIVNETIKGFGANHNAAFKRCHTSWFCVCNPDIRLSGDPFPALFDALAAPRAAVAGPLVRDPNGRIEDSVRRFPTLWTLSKKLFVDRREPDYPADLGPLAVDWVAGMFMLFRSDAFRTVTGFDEAYFLYYEDVDICRRIHRLGWSVTYDPRAEVIHFARRASRRDPRLAMHHLKSMLRFLMSS